MDVKFPLDNYLKYVEAESPPEQERFRGYFLRDVRARLKEVVTRDYINAQQNTLGCVLMFIPNEQIYHFIHEHDSSLMDEALKSQVVLCSPMSLFAILVVIRQAVDNFTVEQTSNRIVAELGTFNKQWEQFTVALQRVGQRIEAAQKAFDTLNGQRRRGLERPLQRIEAIRQQRGLELSPEDDGDGGDIALGHLREGGVTAGGPTTFPSDSTVSGTEAERS
jgi:DNA recombination protein RmuC